MSTKKLDTIIIGGGLCGIYAASLLAEKNISQLVLEARPRLGGRILSPNYKGVAMDLGPSWYWPRINPQVTALVKDLDLETYPQFETGHGRFQGRDGGVETIPGYPMDPPGWRLKGGMGALIQGLCARIPKHVIHLDHPVCEVQKKKGGIRVVVGQLDEAPRCSFEAAHVILALPPRLAASSILFTPDFSHGLTQAMLKASTWMAGQAKFFALYDAAPWREMGFSGQGFSLGGPLGEIHDGSVAAGAPHGLTGFVSIPALRRRDEKTMVQAILSQLSQIHGPAAGQPLCVQYRDWAREEFTATDYDKRSAHNHPEYQPPSGKTSVWDNRFHFAGTETAGHLGGYLEGALISARRAVEAVFQSGL